jgi:hypothetical protein
MKADGDKAVAVPAAGPGIADRHQVNSKLKKMADQGGFTFFAPEIEWRPDGVRPIKLHELEQQGRRALGIRVEGASVEELLTKCKRARRYDHPSTHQADPILQYPIVGSRRAFNFAVQTGKLAPNEEGLFNRAKVLKIFPPLSHNLAQDTTPAVASMRAAYARLCKEGRITTKMTIKERHSIVLGSAEVTSYIAAAGRDRGLGNDRFSETVVKADWSGKPVLH